MIVSILYSTDDRMFNEHGEVDEIKTGRRN
jgi:hypothetical protein